MCSLRLVDYCASKEVNSVLVQVGLLETVQTKTSLIWLRDQAEERLGTRRAIYQTETEESVLQHSWSYILLTTLWYMRAW